MKKVSKILSLVILVAALCSACSTDSTPVSQSQAQLLIGSWKEVSSVTTLCTDALQNKALKTCDTSCETLVVTSSSVTIKNSGVADEVFTYTLSGNVINTTPSSSEALTFLIVGTTLTITGTRPNSGNDANCKKVTTYSKI